MVDIICITGPTASGKTTLAVQVAAAIGSEVISADSRQVYRDMNLGSGKDLDEYVFQGKQIPYHLINIVEAGEEYNVYEYQKDFFEVYKKLKNRKLTPILCGGSGLYIQAVLGDYRMLNVPLNTELRKSLEDKSMDELQAIFRKTGNPHNTTDTSTRKRLVRAIEIASYQNKHPETPSPHPQINPLICAISYEREELRQRITARLKQRLGEGMIEETENLLRKGISPEKLIYYGLEYKFITLHLIGELSYKEMFNKLNIAIHQFSKRQMTWFRRMERQGYDINWINGDTSNDAKLQKVISLLNKA